MANSEGRRDIFLCAVCGILTGLSFWHSNLSFLVWFSLAPFLYRALDSDFKAGLLYSYIFGVFFYFTEIFWLAHVTKIGLVVLVVYCALYPVLFYLAARYFFNKPLAIFSLPAAWILTEWIKEQVWCGFGWGNLGYSQYFAKYFIQPVDIFGAKFISFVIVLVNVFLLEAFLKRKNLIQKWFVAVCIISFCFTYSYIRLKSLSPQAYTQVSIVQPNTPEDDKYHTVSANQAVKRMFDLGQKAPLGSLLIYPEAAWPVLINENGRDVLRDFAIRLDRSMIMGAVEEDKGFYNRALYIQPDSEKEGVYDKIKIVPFGEYVPLRSLLSFIPVINSIGDMIPGREIKIFTYDRNQFGVLICFEDSFPVLAAKFARKSDFLINITNDEWFNGEPQASQHLAIMVFRAIENRISFARAANTGISCAVSLRGDIEKLISASGRDIFVPGIFSAQLPLRDGRSFYTWYPEAFILLCALFLCVLFLTARSFTKKTEVKHER